MNYVEINYFSLLTLVFILLIPMYFSIKYKLSINKKLILSSLRMTVQLLLIGIFLKYIFKINNIWLNLGWFLTMIGVTSYSIVEGSGVKIEKFIIPVGAAIAFSTFLIVLYFMTTILKLENIFEAQYFITVGGMVLGNSLKGNIVGVTTFFKSITKNEKNYLFMISMGANKKEALQPFIKESVLLAINPTISSMATVGIISMPGMMTGQIIGGSDPMSAIKYQIAIMISILVSSFLSVILAILFSAKFSFNSYGVPKHDILK